MPIQPIQDLGGFGRLADILMQKRQMEAQQANQLAAQDLAQRQLDEAIAARAFNQSMAQREATANEAEREANRLFRERQISWKNDELLRAEEDRQRKEALGQAVANALAFQGPLRSGKQMDRSALFANVGAAAASVPGVNLADLLEVQKIVETEYPVDKSGASKYQFGAGGNVVLDGKPYAWTPIQNPLTGEVTINLQEIKGELTSKIGETPEQTKQREIETAQGKASAEAAVKGETEPQTQQNIEARKLSAKKAEEYFDKANTLREGSSLVKEAIDALDSGAWTGPGFDWLPSIRTASATLDNVQKRAGLNVIQSATFGALSDAERKFALSSAIPTNLSPKDLRAWLVEKDRVTTKVADLMEEASIYLSEGGTMGGWMKIQQEKKKGQQPAQPPAATKVTPSTQTIKFMGFE